MDKASEQYDEFTDDAQHLSYFPDCSKVLSFMELEQAWGENKVIENLPFNSALVNLVLDEIKKGCEDESDPDDDEVVFVTEKSVNVNVFSFILTLRTK